MTLLEKYPRASTAIFSLIITGLFGYLLYFILSLDILQDSPGEKKYSVVDKIRYDLGCPNRRNIRLRELPPNSDVKKFPEEHYRTLEYKQFTARTDRDGFIKPSFIHPDPDLKIFFLGGSTTQTFYVAENKRYPYLVGRILERDLHIKVNSENGGMAGNNSLHTVNILVNKVLPYRPDIVVMMENINDLSTLMYEGTYWNKNKSRSHLVCFSKSKETIKGDEWSGSTEQRKILTAEGQQRVITQFRENLQLFINIARAKHIEPILMTQFNKIEDNPEFDTNRSREFTDIFRKLYKQFNQVIREVGGKNQIMVIDLAKQVPHTSEFIYDNAHVNEKGSVLVADVVAAHLNKIIRNKNPHAVMQQGKGRDH
jgi:lysophospholipase L1-like esterase